MRTLTEIFAPGAAPLPEGLRTLTVSPERTIEPGATVRATFAFTNMGGAPATGLRVRFNLPDGLRYVVGSARVDDETLEDPRGETPLLSGNGAEIGDVPPGVEKKVQIAYDVAHAMDNAAVVEIQAALASFEIPVIGSNIWRLVVRSAPNLQNPDTHLEIETLRDARPGEDLALRARIHNAGDSSARDVVVVMPVPENTIYVANSARIDGRIVAADEREPFGYGTASIATQGLGPGASLVAEYRVRIASPLPDRTKIYLWGAVASAEIPEFELTRVEIPISSSVRFDDDRTRFIVEPAGDVQLGQRIRVALRAHNNGTSEAHNVRVRFMLPDGVRFVPGSRLVDGRPTLEGNDPTLFGFDLIAPGENVEASIDGTVLGPPLDGAQLAIGAQLDFGEGSRAFEQTLVVRARPIFDQAHTAVAFVGTPSGRAGEDVRITIRVMNEGTLVARDAILALDFDAGFDDVRFSEDNEGESRLSLERRPSGRGGASIPLGNLEPFKPHSVFLHARIATPIADRRELRLAATLHTREIGAVAVGSAALFTRSRPRFSPAGCSIELLGNEPLRPDRAAEFAVRVTNEGTDIGRDVRVGLTFSPELKFEAVEGATREGNTLIFGDIAPAARAEAHIRVRLAGFVRRGSVMTIEGRLSGVGMLPLAMRPATVQTYAEPDFAKGATFTAEPRDTVETGEPLYFLVALRNDGDGTARRVVIRSVLTANTTYSPGSTSINDVPLIDTAAGSLLWSGSGLVLEDVDPGVEAFIRWRAIVNTPLPAGTIIEARAEIEWDGVGSTMATLQPIRVRSSPAFAIRPAGLPFGVEGAVTTSSPEAYEAPSPLPRAYPALAAAAARSVPSATQVMRPDRALQKPPPAPPEPAGEVGEATYMEPPENINEPHSFLFFTEDRLTRTVTFLQHADFPGLLKHLFVLRAFFPDVFVGQLNATTNEKLATLSDAIRSQLDRLFMKLRLPRYALVSKDLEDRAARTALHELIETLDAPALSRISPPPLSRNIVARIEGSLDVTRLRELRPLLEGAPLGAVYPWIALCLLLGDTVVLSSGERSTALGNYRDALVAILDQVGALPLSEFHRVLEISTNADLDGQLGGVLEMLRGAAPVASQR